MKILIIGNCQAATVAKILRLRLHSAQIDVFAPHDYVENKIKPDDYDKYHHVFLQDIVSPSLRQDIEHLKITTNIKFFPNISFAGFHPDYIYISKKKSTKKLGHQSSIIFNSWLEGLSTDETIKLFSNGFISKLGYDEYYESGKKWLVQKLDECNFDGEFYFSKWKCNSPFMFTVNHPKLYVIADLVAHLCASANIPWLDFDVENYLNDPLRDNGILPYYAVGNSVFDSLESEQQLYRVAGKTFTLFEYITACFKNYERESDDLVVDKKRYEIFQKALESVEPNDVFSAINPYREKPSSSMWRRSVANVDSSNLAPLAYPNPIITATTKVATAGSCFAQHIARTLAKNGLNYYVAEKVPDSLSDEEAKSLGYDLFSARFGNIYTARQLVQLFRRAYGQYQPNDIAWLAKSGKYLDPFRPNIGEEFASEQAVNTQREEHFSAVREMFENLDVFVFTLGLTESWVNTHDGAVYPVAPGVVSQHVNYTNYTFKNFKHDEIREDMVKFFALLRSVNRNAKVLLTVSPVPLIATYEYEHVLSATSYSKSVLRAVAGELTKAFDFVSYFPSYEIITGDFNKGAYFENDLRSVKPEGVSHVMGVFMDYMVEGSEVGQQNSQLEQHTVNSSLLAEIERNADIVCDEELIEEN